MIGAIVKENTVTGLIVIKPENVEKMKAALLCEIVDARPYGLAVGDFRTAAGWTRNDGGEQKVLPLIEQAKSSAIAEQAAIEVLAILRGEVLD